MKLTKETKYEEDRKNKVKSLQKASGLPIYSNNGNIVFNDSVISEPVNYRTFEQTKPYLKNKKAPHSGLSKVYAMYRGIHIPRDEKNFITHHLRYDITVLFPGLLGDEFCKTIGHHHQQLGKQKNKKVTFPEIYEVISGKAIFLFQEIKENSGGKIFAIFAKSKDKVIVPPGYGHITINPTNEPLIIADIFSDSAKSIYSFIKKHHGAAYYVRPSETKSKNTKIVFEKNINYKKTWKLNLAEANKEALGISSKTSLYQSFIKNPEKFEFLTNPEKFKKQLDPENLFILKK